MLMPLSRLAQVRFDDPLPEALACNVRAALALHRFALSCAPQLQVSSHGCHDSSSTGYGPTLLSVFTPQTWSTRSTRSTRSTDIANIHSPTGTVHGS
eukprot:3708515-Pyramimonas_sp.AAC.1